MRKFILTSILLISLVAPLPAADYLRIDADSVLADTTVGLEFYITRQCVVPGYPLLRGASNGFALTATGGATFAYDSVSKHHDDWFSDLGGMAFGHTFTGGQEDSALFLVGGGTISYGIPIVTEEPYFTLWLTMGDGTGAMQIDSAFYPPAGPWKFSHLTCGGGATGDRPGFLDKNFNSGSPFEIAVCPKDCQPPVITNQPPNDTLVADNCNALTYQFQADPGGVAGGGTLFWDMILGIGEIDSVSGLYSFNDTDSNGQYPVQRKWRRRL